MSGPWSIPVGSAKRRTAPCPRVDPGAGERPPRIFAPASTAPLGKIARSSSGTRGYRSGRSPATIHRPRRHAPDWVGSRASPPRPSPGQPVRNRLEFHLVDRCDVGPVGQHKFAGAQPKVERSMSSKAPRSAIGSTSRKCPDVPAARRSPVVRCRDRAAHRRSDPRRFGACLPCPPATPHARSAGCSARPAINASNIWIWTAVR